MTYSPTADVVPLKADLHGVLHVGNTRVPLDAVVAAFVAGATAEEIVHQYSSLRLADVYSVIGHYLRHTAEIDAYLQQRRGQREAVRDHNELRFDPHGVRDRLLARQTVRD